MMVLQRMLRSVTSSLLIGIMTLTAMWGGCVSCPQFFMLPGADSAKDCCEKDGRCKRDSETQQETRKECHQLPLDVQESGAHHSQLASTPAVEPVTASDLATIMRLGPARLEASPHDHSPPDFQSLYATFLI